MQAADCNVGKGLLETWFNPNCGLDIYETCSEDVWVDCATSGARLGFYVATGIIVVILILILFFSGSAGINVIAVLVAAAIIGLMRFGAYYWAGKMARVDYKRYEKEISSYMDKGMSKQEATKLVRDEHEKAKRNEAMMAAAREQSRGSLAAGSLIAAALRR